MLANRIELESNEGFSERYGRAIVGCQRAYELFCDLADIFPNKITKGLVEVTWVRLGKLNPEDYRRRRFFRVFGPIKIPLTNQIHP